MGEGSRHGVGRRPRAGSRTTTSGAARWRRAVFAGALAGTAVFLAAGCSSGGEGAEDAADSFVSALEEGRYADAVELTSAAPSEFVCDWMTSNTPEAAGVDARPLIEIDEVTESEDTAVVEARLLGDPVIPLTLDMQRSGGEWRVQVPADWRLEVDFDSPTVIEASVGDCVLEADGSSGTSTLTWPILHSISLTDPTGVVRNAGSELVSVPEQTAASLPGVPETAVELLDGAVARALWDQWLACGESAIIGTQIAPSCGLSVEQDATNVITEIDGPESTEVERLWTEDGDLWRFESEELTARFEYESGMESYQSFRYTGTLDTTSSGEMVVTLDDE